MTYNQIMEIKCPKSRLWAIMDKIQEIKLGATIGGLSEEEDLELRNLEMQKMNAYSEWKDPN